MLLKPYTAPTVNPTGLYCQHICEDELESTSQVYWGLGLEWPLLLATSHIGQHSIPSSTGGYIARRWVAYDNQALYLVFIGDSDEKSKKGTKRKKPPPAAIENDFLPKRRSARVRNGKCFM